uniref:atypical chemokine receptor 4-like n=1 Tax=Scatophagus argus TaxID=75038 RepID=UPI001ED83C3D|nr:atypical chemokine receptor 4-like [Scatophagus argus]
MSVDCSSDNTSFISFFNSPVNDSSSSGTPLTSHLRPWYIAASVIIAISFLLGVPANIVVIAKLSRHLRGSSMSQRLFFNLAVSDLLCLLCLPVGGVIFLQGLILSHEFCQLFFYFIFFCIATNLNILVLISIQRYCQVLHPKKWDKLGRTWQRFLLFGVWMLGALVALPIVFFLTHDDEQTDGHSWKNLRITPELEVVYIIFVVFSYLALLSFYVLLVRGVNRIKMANRKKPRVIKIFIRIMAASLVVGFLPVIFRIVYVAALLTSSNKVLSVSKKLTVAECFYCFNYCLNPFLYFFSSRNHVTESNKRRSFLMTLDDNF